MDNFSKALDRIRDKYRLQLESRKVMVAAINDRMNKFGEALESLEIPVLWQYDASSNRVSGIAGSQTFEIRLDLLSSLEELENKLLDCYKRAILAHRPPIKR